MRRRRRESRGTANPSAAHSELDATNAFESRERLVALLVIAVATVAAYSNTFAASFHFDDIPNIVQNASAHSLSGPSPSSNRYLGYLSFALNYNFGGERVFGYHVVNVLIHVCNGLLLFWLAEITLRTPALRHAETGPLLRRYLPLAAGLLFAMHPLQTEAVTYVVQRLTSLATLFYLLSIVLLAQARLSFEAERSPNWRAACLYSLSVAAAAAAMKTKEISFTLPLVAAGYELVFFRPRRRLLLVAPLAAAALLIPLGLATQGKTLVDVLGDASRVAAEAPEIPRSVYLLTQARVVVTYVRLLLLPVGQNLDYDFRLSRSIADPDVLFAIVALSAVAGFAVLLLVRSRKTNDATGPLVFFGVGWFFVTLGVESSIIPIRDVIFEHRVYLPSAGASVSLAAALLHGVERLRLRISPALQCAAALLVTAGPLGAATYARNFVWKDEVSLWSDVVARSPLKARPHNNLGLAYQQVGAAADAVREGREAVRLEPEAGHAHYNLANAYAQSRELDDAIREYREAIRLTPGLAKAHNNLGLALEAQDRLVEAAAEYREAVRLDATSAKPHDNLGRSYARNGQLDGAIAQYREAIRLAPWLGEARSHLGSALYAKGQHEDAVREYLAALEILPTDAATLDALGHVYLDEGKYDDAIAAFEKAASVLVPAHATRGAGVVAPPTESGRLASTRTGLGIALESRGRLEEAIAQYREAIRLDPALSLPHQRLGIALEARGRVEEAIPEYLTALEIAPQDPETLDDLGNAYVKLAKYDDAIVAFRRAIRALSQAQTERSSGNARSGSAPGRRRGESAREAATRINLGIAHEGKGQVGDAVREYREAIRLDPGRAEAHNDLGDLMRKLGRAGEAVQECRRAVELKAIPEFVFNLALALEAAGRRDEAIAHYQRFLEEAGQKYPDLAETVRGRMSRLRAGGD